MNFQNNELDDIIDKIIYKVGEEIKASGEYKKKIKKLTWENEKLKSEIYMQNNRILRYSYEVADLMKENRKLKKEVEENG